ncbi:MAG TPA: acetyl-CoA C-acyltransferase, partial [Deltaproteobacteria bacterium]|nr:acetyl-CoA C-acyltransferase [Deltaproteobacteria bacterium]
AFAGSTVAVIRELGIDMDRVNVNGGSVALGHPIGSSGTRVLATLLYEMIRSGKKTGVASLCLGGGEAVALVVTR